MKDRARQAFWDTSALVPLCCYQTITRESRDLWRRFSKMVVWWITRIEVQSAFSRLVREGVMSELQCNQAQARLQLLSTQWREINPVERVRNLAEACLARYPLTAADAVQLGSALVWCKEKPARRAFLCFDPRLWAAAKEAGFDLYPESKPER